MKTFTSRFSSTCGKCGQRIEKDELINWTPGYSEHATQDACELALSIAANTIPVVTVVQGPAEDPSFDLRQFPVGGRGKGYAAVMTDQGDETVFFRIDRPTKGTFTGWVFIKWVYGEVERRIAKQRPDGSVSYYDPRDEDRFDFLLNQIAADPEPAQRLYGQKIGRCACCHKQLTDETSRARGIGPECIKGYSAR